MAFFAASVDPPETNRQFAEKLGLDYPILSDPGKQVATAFGVVGPDRELPRRWTFYIGPDGRILHVDTEVKPATAGQEVAARLGALGVKKVK